MKKYKYTAFNLERKKFSGVYFANNEDDLRAKLADQGLFLISYRAVADKSPNAFFSLTGKVKMKEITHFCRQLSIMINSSIELIGCLEILKEQSFSKFFKQVLEMVYEDVKSGKLLSQAMEKHKKIFPNFFRNMIYVGEMSSSLEKVLQNIADYYENESRTKSKVKSAMVYPIMLLVMTLGILVLMMLVVVPTFKTSLGEMEIEMPGITMAIFNLSDFIMQNWMMIFLVLAGVVLLFILLGKTNNGRFFFDMLGMKIGVIKRYKTAKVTAIFSRAFGMLLSSGMHIVDAMEVVQKILGNKYVEKKFAAATEEVRKGVSLTNALENMNIFPPMLIQMIAVGERTASLDETLLRTCGYFDDELQNSLNALTSMIQPILMLFMGVSIGIIFIAVYSPMLSIMQGIA
ncbi:MAG: type II secretion system F family protein [Clostridia bacterium]|nr:type II secretion system F family protein [Clostridia bacterium]MBR2433589.1 type II secretion system F family protein [Clostridia bacterium]MBR3790469.1 type II secretion system F family protein [Clostridia bacterium]